MGLVDIVNSTKISATLTQKKLSEHYEVFLNSMANIVEQFRGCVIKNVGDGLLYYFPESSKSSKKYRVLSCLECCLTMSELHDPINKKIQNQDLPPLNYRISTDYGKVVIMKPNRSSSMDILGTPVNICTKINRIASQNGIVVGSDLYEMVKNFDDYKFKLRDQYSLGLKNAYPIYSMQRNH